MEATVHRSVAAARGGASKGSRTQPHLDEVRAALAEVTDPEIPVVSIVDLGMVDDVNVDADGIHVSLLPTFVGCPALDVIRSSVEERLGAFDRLVDVRFDHRVAWSSDRITPTGRAALLAAGLAPPGPVHPDAPVLVRLSQPIPCPNCGSSRTVLESPFGPTQCRAIYHCTACRQPFETIKTI